MSIRGLVIALIIAICVMVALKPSKPLDCCYGHSMIIGNITSNTAVPHKDKK